MQHRRKEGLTDPHERTANFLAEALRSHGKLLALPSSAEGLRLHPRPHGERCALSAGTPRRLRAAKQLPSRDRTDRKLPRVHRGCQATPRRDFQIGGVQALSSQLLRISLPRTLINKAAGYLAALRRPDGIFPVLDDQ